MSVRLNNPIWTKAKRANLYAKAIYAVGTEAVKDVNVNYDTAKRSGVIAKVQKVTLSGKNKGKVRGFRTVQRSAYGETPAKVTGKLRRGTKIKRVSAFQVNIINNVPYAKYLEPPAKLNRPFLKKPIDANRKKYVEMFRKEILRGVRGVK